MQESFVLGLDPLAVYIQKLTETWDDILILSEKMEVGIPADEDTNHSAAMDRLDAVRITTLTPVGL